MLSIKELMEILVHQDILSEEDIGKLYTPIITMRDNHIRNYREVYHTVSIGD